MLSFLGSVLRCISVATTTVLAGSSGTRGVGGWGCRTLVGKCQSLAVLDGLAELLSSAYTIDEERFPVHNFVGDFDENNEDAAEMGHMGLFLNAYICPTMVRGYYAWKLDRPGFAPSNPIWQQDVKSVDVVSQTSLGVRIILLGCLLVVAVYGGKVEQLLGGMILLGLFLVPIQMIGFLRYVPWYVGCIFIATESLNSRRTLRQMYRNVSCGLLLSSVVFNRFPESLFGVCVMFDFRYATEHLLDTSTPKIVYAYPLVSSGKSYTQQEASRVPNRFNPLIIGAYSVRQLCRLEPRLHRTRVETFQAYKSGNINCSLFSWVSFVLEERERLHFETESLFINNLREPSRLKRILNYPGIVIKCCVFRMPALLWRKIKSLCEVPSY